MSPPLTALLLRPIATELPETMNALIWARQGKERLALANISGSMLIQAAVPTAFGLFFTPWRLVPELQIAAAVTTIAVAWLFWMFRKGDVGGRQLLRVPWLSASFKLEAAAPGAAPPQALALQKDATDVIPARHAAIIARK